MTGCHNIAERSCDLSSAMMNIRLKYYVKVMVDELCIGEFRNFIPSEQSKILEIKKNKLYVHCGILWILYDLCVKILYYLKGCI